MPEKSIRQVVNGVIISASKGVGKYSCFLNDIALYEIKGILKEKVTVILDDAMMKEYGMFRVGFVEEIVERIIREIE